MKYLWFTLLGLLLVPGNAQTLLAQAQDAKPPERTVYYYPSKDFVTGEVRLRVHVMPGKEYNQLVVAYLFTEKHGEVAHAIFMGNSKTRTYGCISENSIFFLTKHDDKTLHLSAWTDKKTIDVTFLTKQKKSEVPSSFSYSTGVASTAIPWGQDGTPAHPDGWPGRPGCWPTKVSALEKPNEAQVGSPDKTGGDGNSSSTDTKDHGDK